MITTANDPIGGAVRYQLSDQLGGGQYDAKPGSCLDSDMFEVDLPDGRIHVPRSMLTAITPDEPPLGSIGIDTEGDAWHHKRLGFWYFGTGIRAWYLLNQDHGPITIVYTPGVSAPPASLVDLTEALQVPCALPTHDGKRMLHIDHGNQARQLKIFVTDGELFSRAAIISYDTAGRAAQTLLQAIAAPAAESRGGQ